MPEGHTVHRLARTFRELFAGRTVMVSSPQGRFAAGAELLDGLVLAASEAYGKQMFLAFLPSAPGGAEGGPAPLVGAERTGARWLRVHLGLYGAWTFSSDGSAAVVHAIGAPRRRVGEGEQDLRPPEPGDDGGWEAPAPRGQVRVRLRTDQAVADLTGPIRCEVVSSQEMDDVVAGLGPDPLRSDADPDRFLDAVGRSRSSVAVLLMDQSVVAGVGNIYRAEVLFRARLDPATPGRAVPREVLEEIWADLVVLMADGARTGAIVTTRPEDRDTPARDGTAGTSTPGTSAAGRGAGRGRRRTRQNTDGRPGAVPEHEAFYVYHRDGLPCRVCGTTVLVREVAARALYWCPRCQS